LDIGDAGDGAAHGVGGVGHAEGAIAVAAAALVSNQVAVAADAPGGEAGARTINGDEGVDLSFELFVEQMADAAEIALALFADGGDEEDGAVEGGVVFMESAGDGKDAGEAAAIVTDAEALHFIAFAFNGNVHAFGEYRVEMGAEDD